MDADRFDALARSLTATGSRRRALTALGGSLGLLGMALPNEATAAKTGKCKPKCGECEKCKKGDCKRKNGKKRCKKGKCQPLTGPACSGGRVCQAGACVCAGAREFCGLDCGCCVPNAPVSGALPGRHTCTASSECCGGGTCCNFDDPNDPREGPRCYDLSSHTSACGTICQNVDNCFGYDPERQCVNGLCV
jgi:hypothetical protein